MPMRRSSAFTLVEVAVAITLTIILAGIAIPRYNSLIRTQDFYAQAQELVSCFQRAQSLASGSQGATLSTGNPIRWTAAELSRNDANPSPITCTVIAFEDLPGTDDLASFASGFPASTLSSGNNTYSVNDMLITGLNNRSSRRIYFGTLEKGAPVADSDINPQPALGQGLTLSIPLTSALDTSITALLTMGRGGAPIEVKR